MTEGSKWPRTYANVLNLQRVDTASGLQARSPQCALPCKERNRRYTVFTSTCVVHARDMRWHATGAVSSHVRGGRQCPPLSAGTPLIAPRREPRDGGRRQMYASPHSRSFECKQLHIWIQIARSSAEHEIRCGHLTLTCTCAALASPELWQSVVNSARTRTSAPCDTALMRRFPLQTKRRARAAAAEEAMRRKSAEA